MMIYPWGNKDLFGANDLHLSRMACSNRSQLNQLQTKIFINRADERTMVVILLHRDRRARLFRPTTVQHITQLHIYSYAEVFSRYIVCRLYCTDATLCEDDDDDDSQQQQLEMLFTAAARGTVRSGRRTSSPLSTPICGSGGGGRLIRYIASRAYTTSFTSRGQSAS
ncbi:unnamed protein product [Trichogramma brassicae]|uniref:Uncharacterized protein n=1 Tax=Trichogramma brassicae TaxID=86971 RepID=A0A6H5IN90_9HYME|nr:unnamed protein product [Trichogramma brassicae]